MAETNPSDPAKVTRRPRTAKPAVEPGKAGTAKPAGKAGVSPAPAALPERSRRTRSVAELVPAIGGHAFRRFGFTQSAVVERWVEIVGVQYARHSRPESLTFPRGKKEGGTLKIAVTGALAPMLRHAEPQVIERVNRILGYAAVAKLLLRHGDVVAEPAPPARPRPAPVELSPDTRSTLRDIGDPDLRASLEALAQALSWSKGPPVVR